MFSKVNPNNKKEMKTKKSKSRKSLAFMLVELFGCYRDNSDSRVYAAAGLE
ncbi:MAG: hypothetical protein WC071_06015 [Victivallaceae bacterium]